MKNFKRATSSDLQNMLWELIDEKEFNANNYKKLTKEDKQLFDEVL